MSTFSELAPLAPELFLLCAVCGLLLIDLFVSSQRRGLIHFLAIAILLFTAALTLRPDGAVGDVVTVKVFNGMFIHDAAGDLMKMFVYFTTIVVFMYAKPYLKARGLFQGEYYTLCLFAVLGMMVLISAGSLITVYLGLELLALSSYGLVALNRDSPVSSEAAMKYFVLGALASGMLLYGMSMIYGAAGTLDLGGIHGQVAAGYERTLLVFGLVFVVVGVAFKFGAVPFHMWMPDVYQGAPTAVTVFIASAPKIAAFGMAYRLFGEGLSGMQADWGQMLAALAVLSLGLGNIVAIAQTNLKRMLAYSTISHVGFLFLGLLAGTALGYGAALFYVVTYAITATASFGILILLSRSDFEAENIDDLKGLNQRNSWYAMIMLLTMASLAGVPLTVGFLAKFQVLAAALDAGMMWVVIAGGVFAVIGAYYYLRVIKVMYFDEPADSEALKLPDDLPFRFVLSVNGIALLVLGIFGAPLLAWCVKVTA